MAMDGRKELWPIFKIKLEEKGKTTKALTKYTRFYPS
jgi:hypothetical protein